MNILGIDYGDSKIGLALSSGECSSPLAVISHDGYKKKLLELIKEKTVETIVVGLPISMSGKYSNSSLKAVSFSEKIKKLTRLPVYMVDERLSSAFANTIMKLSGTKKSMEDAVSAADILDRYIRNPSTGYEIKEKFPTCRIDTNQLSGRNILLYNPLSPIIQGIEEIDCERVDIYCEHPQVYLHFKSKGFLPKNLRDELELSCYDIIVIGENTDQGIFESFTGTFFRLLCP
ncbi:hypothetical protein AT15_07870 [Kosmotoga arenicorallina S304]|uniref:Putative pre-16S rRNA nuclease n=1 Tax=Kosmotoga arenicorallina S304 TaxID=1453497 RepID=A0A182C7U4_9BACT|nr:Holliday junction resolvase RuvX [Kosmotoga arenicorallina]OAA31404.1 hypothetical protein AT15_07870 [Kosmotoga arenicorallina S304]